MFSKASPLVILKKPAHCSYAFGPNLLTFNKSERVLKGPLSSLYLTIFSAIVELIQETYYSKDGDAELTSTQTILTQSSTTPPKTVFNFF